MYSKTEIVKSVVSSLTEKGIRKTDSKGKLENYCSDSPPRNDFEYNIRGHIYDGDDLIVKSVPYPKVDLSGLDIKEADISVMREGTIIRIFYYNNEWFVTTHRKLDAYKAHWGNTCFGDLFWDTIEKKCWLTKEDFLDGLNKELLYLFVIGTDENTRIVAPAYSDVKLVSVYDLKTFTKVNDVKFGFDFQNWFTEKLTFESVDEAVEYVNNKFSYPFADGYGLFVEKNGITYKIINKEYETLSNLRHNTPSIMFAYVNNMLNEKNKKLFMKMYPNHEESFKFYDIEFENIVNDIKIKYTKRYINKEEFTVSKPEHNVLYHLHGKYLKSRSPITIESVKELFSELNASCLNKIIGERKRERKLKQLQEEQD